MATVNEEIHPSKGQGGNFQRAFALKSHINGFLDISRKAYSEIIDSMREYIENLSKEYNIPLNLTYTSQKGYHVMMKLSAGYRNMKKSDLPNIFIHVIKLNRSFSMTTADLVFFNQRIQNVLDEILNISNRYICFNYLEALTI